MLVTVGILMLYPDATKPGVHIGMQLPITIEAWCRNATIFGLSGPYVGFKPTFPRLVPPAWLLDVELCFYVAMGLVLSRTRAITLVWWTASIAYTCHLLLENVSWTVRYWPVAAASLPFSTGAMLYHVRRPLLRFVDAGMHRVATATRTAPGTVRLLLAATLMAMFTTNALLVSRFWVVPMRGGVYFSLGLAVATVLLLETIRRDDTSARFAEIDRTLGALSYPIFIGHYLVTQAVAIAWSDGRNPGGPALLLLSLVPLNAVAFALHAWIERPLARTRDAIRSSR